jgi:HD-GYP domain-containing protein (c-di-GMP phosphodiesterase class II)
MNRLSLSMSTLVLLGLCFAGGAVAAWGALLLPSPWGWFFLPLFGLLCFVLVREQWLTPFSSLIGWARDPLGEPLPDLPRLHLLPRELLQHTESLVSMVEQITAAEEDLREQYDRLEARERQLEGLHEAACLLGSGSEPEEWFPKLGGYLGPRFDLLGMDLYFYDEERGLLHRKAAWALRPELYDTVDELPLSTPSICGTAFVSGTLQNVREVARCPFYLPANSRTRSQLAIPLIHWQKPLGVLNMESERPNGFPAEDLLFFRGLAELAAQEAANTLMEERRRADLLQSLTGLARAVELRDPYTGKHQERVADLAVRLARAVGLPYREIGAIRTGALLHDIGKIGIPDAILLKPEPLTAEEFGLIRTHPLKGDELLSRIPFLADSRPGVRSHHERWDGKGYPDGLAEEAIPLSARIIAVADAFDAMTTHRVYRPPFPEDVALGELRACRGKQFDPILVDAFMGMLPTVVQVPSPLPAGSFGR